MLLPPGVYATGVSLITYQCPESLPNFIGYDIKDSGGGKCDELFATFNGIGSILGLQITGALVSFNLTTGVIELTNYSTWSNAGNCNSNYLDVSIGVYTMDASGG